MRRLRFVIVFLVLLAAFEVPLLLGPVDRGLVRPFTAGVTHVAAAMIALIQPDARVSGTVIASRCFAVDVRNGCNGLEASFFLLAAVLAFPASARLRVIGVALGLAIVQVANLLRIISLFLIGCYRPQWFEAFHLTVWQTIIFAVAVGFFLLWTRRAAADAVNA